METFTTFGGARNWVFARVETEGGIHGWGEASTELWEATVATAIRELGARLVGMDAMATEQVWQRATRHGFWRGGVVLGSAVAAIDQALWDIRGKVLGVPVYTLLGGPTRDWVPTYRHVGIYTPDSLAQQGQALVSQGVRTIKTGAWVLDSALPERDRLRKAQERLTALREAVGEEIEILLDHHGRAELDEAIRMLHVAAPFRPRWIEEPTPPERTDLLGPWAREARGLGISVALGERLFSRSEFRPVLQQGLIDVAQPDLCHAGGITEVMKIAAMADTFGVALAPHNPGGPVSTAASAHVAMAVPNRVILELCPDEPRRSEICIEPWQLQPDRLLVPDRPGLGIDLDVDAIKAVPARQIKVPTQAFRHDGSVADI